LTDATKQKRLECDAVLVRRFKVRNRNSLRTKCTDYLSKDQWTPDSLGLSPLVILAGSNVGGYHKHHPKRKTIIELQETLQRIWNSLLRRLIDKATRSFQSDQGLFWS